MLSAVQRLLAGDVDADDPVVALARAARPPDPDGGWVKLIVWDELPGLLRQLAQLPEAKPRPQEIVPRWDPAAGILRYGGRVAVKRIDPQAGNIRAVLDEFQAKGCPPAR